MPGPTTESLAERLDGMGEDMTELKADAAVFKSQLGTLTGEVGQLRADVRGLREDFAGFRSEIRALVGVVKWVGGIAGAALIVSALSAVWWAGRIDAEVRSMAEDTRALKSAVARPEPRERTADVRPEPAPPGQ